jgi:hypothetical protein
MDVPIFPALSPIVRSSIFKMLLFGPTAISQSHLTSHRTMSSVRPLSCQATHQSAQALLLLELHPATLDQVRAELLQPLQQLSPHSVIRVGSASRLEILIFRELSLLSRPVTLHRGLRPQPPRVHLLHRPYLRRQQAISVPALLHLVSLCRKFCGLKKPLLLLVLFQLQL